MWTRKEVKEKGKTSFKRNYWKSVLVALIFTLIAGGMSGGYGGGSAGSLSNFAQNPGNGMIGEVKEDVEDAKEDLKDAKEELEDAKEEIKVEVEKAEDGDGVYVNVDDIDDIEEVVQAAQETIPAGVIVVIVIVSILIFTVIFAIAFALAAFLLNPVELGCDRFFVKNLDEPAEVAKNVFFAFDNGYLKKVKTMFLRDIYTFLWSLLFIIPGIIKSYEYRMIPYLLADNPDMDSKEAFAKSREMMSGQKWKAFVLDLSFIGWDLLSILTCGILSLFYVAPYKHATSAALYDTLKDKDAAVIESEIPSVEA